ncbi:MAG TPA: sugar phosphate nucleotidyltransferase [Candidatus Binataceae bacterium]|nr:sugar phosphate nucleotidyltransferase [Candidatus Binataceae bacterium]
MDRDQTSRYKDSRTALILAGGEGTRLAELTRRADGAHVPKQFCRLVSGISLLDQTRQRAARSVSPEHTFLVLNRNHERFYTPSVGGVPPQNLIIQPLNRGTAVAILYALLRIAEVAPRSSVLIVPSDHHVNDEMALMQCVDLAFAAVEEDPKLSVLLGIAAGEPESGYGWIEPGPAVSARQPEILQVRRFWEKPSRVLARELMAKGCLWNSFMLIGVVPTLIGLFMLAMPELYITFTMIKLSLGTVFEDETARRLYEDLRPSDFSRDILQSLAGNFSVLPVSDVGWSDLGEPHRVFALRAMLGGQPKEATA